MLRLTVPTLTLLFLAPLGAQAASKQEFELSKMLEKVAQESSVGTPRAINEDILDQGYTVNGNELINHLSVREGQARQMRGNPDAVRNQLGNSVCHNNGYRQLMTKGAVLKYQFSEYKTNRPIVTQTFQASDCSVKKPNK
ncbi:quorum-sensing-regulated virulence factor family protein [Pseudomonas cichorii]|nr:quorum-sensing-regulated virulence factor family protein [Pseudomonas cichorii]